MEGANYSGLFNDKRLECRGLSLLSSLLKKTYSSIQSISASRAEQKGFYRFLRNDKVTEGVLIDELRQRCGRSCKGRHVLAIQDTTEINLRNHRNRISYDDSIGPINDDKGGFGFKVHPTFVIDAISCYPYGYSAMDIWSRPYDKPSLSSYEQQRQLVEEKESNYWLKGNEQICSSLAEASTVIIIQDREGDFYEQFAEPPCGDQFFLLVRSNYNRRLEDGSKLCDYINSLPVAGSFNTIIPYQNEQKIRKEREALIEVKVGKVKLKKPHKKQPHITKTSVELTVIEAKEANCGEASSILWRLYTTWPVANFEDAWQVIEWYRCRWFIEEVFKVLKKECYNIEASELESGAGIRKLTVLLLDTIVKLFQLAIAYSLPEDEMPDCSTIFEPNEVECLSKINTQLKGKTEKQSNPFNKPKLGWAFWVLARLGGWKGYASQRKAGFETLIKGIDKFYSFYQGYLLQKDVGTQ